MRQIFFSLPWIAPELPPLIAAIYQQHGVPLKVKKNEVIKSPDAAPKCFYLKSGICAYQVENQNRGVPSILELILPGRSMCDVTAVTEKHCNVQTVAWSDCELLAIPPRMLMGEAEKDPETLKSMTLDIIAKQETHIETMTANLNLEPQVRLKTLLLTLLTAYGVKPGPEWKVVPLMLNNSRYAEAVNLSRVSVSRFLSEWQAAGLIKKEGRAVFVRDSLFSDVFDWAEGNGLSVSPEGYRIH